MAQSKGSSTFSSDTFYRPTQPAPPSIKELRLEAKPLSDDGLFLEVKGGFATFQDIQPPLDESGERRVDGTYGDLDSKNHSGLSLMGKAGYQRLSNLGLFSSGLSFLRATAAAPVGSLSSSYQRIALSTDMAWSLSSDYETSILTGLDLRRSSYRNTDNAHYIDAALAKLGLQIGESSLSLGGSFGYAPLTQVGYSQSDNESVTGILENTTSRLSEIDVHLRWKVDPSTQFIVQFEQETVDIVINNLSAYRTIGLKVDDASETTQKAYRLSTSVISIGASKRF